MGMTKAPPSWGGFENAGRERTHRWLLLSERQFSLLGRRKGFLEEMGLVSGVERWVIIVIILLFLLTPGAMLSILNALSALISSDLMRQLFIFLPMWVEAEAQQEEGTCPK